MFHGNKMTPSKIESELKPKYRGYGITAVYKSLGVIIQKDG